MSYWKKDSRAVDGVRVTKFMGKTIAYRAARLDVRVMVDADGVAQFINGQIIFEFRWLAPYDLMNMTISWLDQEIFANDDVTLSNRMTYISETLAGLKALAATSTCAQVRLNSRDGSLSSRWSA